MRVTGLVLAGGYSTRMGSDKSELKLPDGRTLLQRQVDVLLQSGVDEVLVSRRGDQPAVGVPARVVVDEVRDRGPLAGIAAGLNAISEGVLVVLAVDIPFISVEALQAMIALATDDRGVVPHRGNSIECLVGVYPKSLAKIAAARVAEGKLRVREFAAWAEENGHAVPWEIPERLIPEFKNWNRPEDVTK